MTSEYAESIKKNYADLISEGYLPYFESLRENEINLRIAKLNSKKKGQSIFVYNIHQDKLEELIIGEKGLELKIKPAVHSEEMVNIFVKNGD